ncbi:unnamed protein product [Periconia digitata]|uniref:CCHC-type domain-containing protein n=1 Tax=Periconia digitata TaxID=1303443 RepID=A0A9W4US52_9PLEO|nr:unnamed protein product [Periconia digitata]
MTTERGNSLNEFLQNLPFNNNPDIVPDEDNHRPLSIMSTQHQHQHQSDAHRAEDYLEEEEHRRSFPQLRLPRGKELSFSGENVTAFLDDYNRICNNAGYTDLAKLRTLPEWCDREPELLIKQLPAFKSGSWKDLQKVMKEHWEDLDPEQQMGTEAFLRAFVEESSHGKLSFELYYTRFCIYSNACIDKGQITMNSRGRWFMKGLKPEHRHQVMFDMPESERTTDDGTSPYDLNKIYAFLKRRVRAEKELRYLEDETSSSLRRKAQYMAEQEAKPLAKATQPTAARERHETATGSTNETDPVDDLISKFKGMTLSMADAVMVASQERIQRECFKHSTDMARFIVAVTAARPRSGNPPMATYQARAMDQPKRDEGSWEQKSTLECWGCGEKGHGVSGCDHLQDLQNRGWVSKFKDRRDGEWKWKFGSVNRSLGLVGSDGRPPQRGILTWLQQCCANRYQVTTESLARPMPEVCPDIAKAAEANIITEEASQKNGPSANQKRVMFNRGVAMIDNDNEVFLLDEIDKRHIILNPDITESNAATRSQNQGDSTEESLDRVRDARVKKTRVPARDRTYERVQEQIRNSRLPGDLVMDDQDELDELSIPYEAQPHNNPYAVVKPPRATRPRKEPEEEEEGDPALSRILGQEIKGLRLRDLLDHPTILSPLLKELKQREEKKTPESSPTPTVETSHVETPRHQNCVRNELGPDPDETTLAPRASRIQDQSKTVGHNQLNLIGRDHPTSGADYQEQYGRWDGYEVNNVEVQVNAGMRHHVGGEEDTYQEPLDHIPGKAVNQRHRTDGVVRVAGELPIAWANIGRHSAECLIDTGSQINLIRLSAARALRIAIEEDMDGTIGQMRGATGAMEAFIGTAWHVPVRIGAVTVPTTFRVVTHCSRSVILGAPWCASVRLALQYTALGRVTCRILALTGKQNAMFLAADPPTWNKRDYEDSPPNQGTEEYDE